MLLWFLRLCVCAFFACGCAERKRRKKIKKFALKIFCGCLWCCDFLLRFVGSLAQSVVRKSHNLKVVSSILTAPILFLFFFSLSFPLFSLFSFSFLLSFSLPIFSFYFIATTVSLPSVHSPPSRAPLHFACTTVLASFPLFCPLRLNAKPKTIPLLARPQHAPRWSRRRSTCTHATSPSSTRAARTSTSSRCCTASSSRTTASPSASPPPGGSHTSRTGRPSCSPRASTTRKSTPSATSSSLTARCTAHTALSSPGHCTHIFALVQVHTCTLSFVRPSFHLFALLFIHPSIHPFIHLLTHSPIRSSIHSPIRFSFICSPTPVLAFHSFMHLRSPSPLLSFLTHLRSFFYPHHFSLPPLFLPSSFHTHIHGTFTSASHTTEDPTHTPSPQQDTLHSRLRRDHRGSPPHSYKAKQLFVKAVPFCTYLIVHMGVVDDSGALKTPVTTLNVPLSRLPFTA